MKKAIIVLIMMVNSAALFAQDVLIKAPGLFSYLQTKKKSVNLFRCNTEQCDYKNFIKIYNQQAQLNSLTKQPKAFMYNHVAFSTALPVEFSKDANSLYQRSEVGRGPSSALQILGFVAGITASSLAPNYYQWNNNESAVDAYLRSTYRQHDK